MKHHVLIDSQDRDFELYPNSNEYRILFPRTFTDVVAARLLGVELPASFYVFTAAHGNTTLRVGLSSSSVITPTTEVTLSDGNYDASSMVLELTKTLNDAFPGKTFSVNVDERTFRLRISCHQGDDVIVDTTNAPVNTPTHWGLAYNLGFERDTIMQAETIVSPNVINLNPYTYIILDIRELNQIDEGGMHGNELGKRCFAKVPLNGVSFDVVFRDVDQCPDWIYFNNPIAKIDRLHVAWRFHDGSVPDFKGAEHSLYLELWTSDQSSTMVRVHAKPADAEPTGLHSLPPALGDMMATTSTILNADADAKSSSYLSRHRRKLILVGILVIATLAMYYYIFAGN
jgi:hypothetical protein